ncbi:hypothetical protein ACS0TY_022677 [Phlomoides rotata]
MNNFINYIFEKSAQEAARLARYNKKPTISSLEIQTAVRHVLTVDFTENPSLSPSKKQILPAKQTRTNIQIHKFCIYTPGRNTERQRGFGVIGSDGKQENENGK